MNTILIIPRHIKWWEIKKDIGCNVVRYTCKCCGMIIIYFPEHKELSVCLRSVNQLRKDWIYTGKRKKLFDYDTVWEYESKDRYYKNYKRWNQ